MYLHTQVILKLGLTVSVLPIMTQECYKSGLTSDLFFDIGAKGEASMSAIEPIVLAGDRAAQVGAAGADPRCDREAFAIQVGLVREINVVRLLAVLANEEGLAAAFHLDEAGALSLARRVWRLEVGDARVRSLVEIDMENEVGRELLCRQRRYPN